MSTSKNLFKSAFSGKITWVTGAGSGIGRALCQGLLEAGATVIASDVRPESLDQLAAADSDRLQRKVFDVADAQAFADAAKEIVARWGRIDFLFNNAGIGVGGRADSIPAPSWRQMFEVNVFGVINGIQAVYAEMIARGSGHIINLGSVAGLVPLPAEVPYSASKHAVVGMSRSLALESRRYGVRVTTVCPGKIETPMYDRSPIYGLNRAALLKRIPRGVSAEECADEILSAVAQGKEIVIVTKLARFLHALHRYAPRVSLYLLRRYYDKIHQEAA
ncbi:MAG: SDR family oxidoreductase [Deltaproteobacteria bacterium]|nr:SDR family oxidoreductase [Deltaproteobacteria bacterium]